MLHAVLQIRLSILQIVLIAIVTAIVYIVYKVTEYYFPGNGTVATVRSLGTAVVVSYLFLK